MEPCARLLPNFAGSCCNESALDWVIVGGESGPGARPMRTDWVRSIRDQCVAAKVPFFFKQWGEWGPAEWADISTREVFRLGKKATGRLLDGRKWNEMPKERK